MCSGRHGGIECGQKILPINGNPAAYGEYFCCVYVTLQNRKSQVIFSVPVVQILDSIKQGKRLFEIAVLLAHFVYGLSKNRTGMLVGIIVCVFLVKVVIE